MAAESIARLVMFGMPCVLAGDRRHDIPETAPAYLGLFLVRFGGLLGILLLLILYLFRGTFSFLVADSLQDDSAWSASMPFLKTRDD